jgi:ubiquinone/menaquinone biosynthesis C-methylase UbiE
MGLYSNYIFPRILDWSLGTRLIRNERRTALECLKGHVLEIGFGTGLNLPCYPPQVTRLTTLDSEEMLRDLVARRIDDALMPVTQLKIDANGRLPFEDNSFDGVATTFTLCSIRDVQSALAEIYRVLAPAGKYVFLEHGRSDEQRVARRQDLLNPIQQWVACGCNLNRPIDQLVRDANLQIKNLERYCMPNTPRIFGEMYRGVACKVGGS